jgi:hypothetical protein
MGRENDGVRRKGVSARTGRQYQLRIYNDFGIWPEPSKYIEEQFAGLSPEVVHKITCENAAKFYGLIN